MSREVSSLNREVVGIYYSIELPGESNVKLGDHDGQHCRGACKIAERKELKSSYAKRKIKGR